MKLKAKLKVKNPMGLHTRPATEIVKLLRKFKSKVDLKYKKDTVNAKSILGILMLAAHQNAVVEVIAEGVDAELAISTLRNAFEANFGDQHAYS